MDSLVPRCIRNNNPGDLRPLPVDIPAFDATTGKLICALPHDLWNGVVALDLAEPDPPYLVFQDLAHGVRAIARQLGSYQDKHGIHTIGGVALRWAPSKDRNDPIRYAHVVAGYANIQVSDEVDLHDADALFGIVKGIIRMEGGQEALDYVTDQVVRSGIALALGTAHSQ